jgi:hypothetical protein
MKYSYLETKSHRVNMSFNIHGTPGSKVVENSTKLLALGVRK